MAVPTRPAPGGIVDPTWGQWVHDDLAGFGQYSVGVSLASQSVSTTGTNLVGTLVPPAAAFDRLFLCTFSVYLSTTADIDVYLAVPGGTTPKRVRFQVAGSTAAMTYAHPVAASGNTSFFAVHVKAVTGTATVSTGGGADLNWLQIVTLPAGT